MVALRTGFWFGIIFVKLVDMKKKNNFSGKSADTDINKLAGRLKELAHYGSALALLSWDQEVNMPKRGSERRAETIAHLSGVLHNKLISIDCDGLLTKLKDRLDNKELGAREAVIVSETWRNYERERKLPEEFVVELAELVSRAQAVWAEARRENNFKKFQPWLEKIVSLKRQEAKFVGYADEPYDALLDVYEPGMKTAETAMILNDLKDFLIPFVREIRNSKVKIDPKVIRGNYPRAGQDKIGRLMAERIGFDYEAGRIDESTHPFTTNFHAEDVRFTVRYDLADPRQALFSYLHEGGHALYEQGLQAEHFGTPLGESISLGIHESQSRLWENIIGRSREFWKYFYPKLQKEFPETLGTVSLENYYQVINQVKPSLIRVDADEVTYSLHIIVRFEIERELLNGAIRIADLPKIWKQKMGEYLGIEVPNDKLGVLQDVHWAGGLFGYFPTYALGNLYASQFYESAKKGVSGLAGKISRGNLLPLREWLRRNIHIHGKFYSAGGLIREVTGEELSSRYFINYLRRKYGELYQLG